MAATKQGFISGNDLYSLRNERLVHAVVWSVTAILPFVLELWNLITDSSFDWDFVLRWWSGMLPLIIIFLVNNLFLIPNFMKKGRMDLYIISVTALMVAYAGYSSHTEAKNSTGLQKRSTDTGSCFRAMILLPDTGKRMSCI